MYVPFWRKAQLVLRVVGRVAFCGIYSTLGSLGGSYDEEAGASRSSPTGGLPRIPEEKLQAVEKAQVPTTAHARGDWMPEEEKSDPYQWTPVLDAIAEGTEEDAESFKTADSPFSAWEDLIYLSATEQGPIAQTGVHPHWQLQMA